MATKRPKRGGKVGRRWTCYVPPGYVSVAMLAPRLDGGSEAHARTLARKVCPTGRLWLTESMAERAVQLWQWLRMRLTCAVALGRRPVGFLARRGYRFRVSVSQSSGTPATRHARGEVAASSRRVSPPSGGESVSCSDPRRINARHRVDPNELIG